jgi:hypothetical protein
MGRAPARGVAGERVALSADWQWGDRYLRAGLSGTVLGRDPFGRLLVDLDCFTADSTPQLLTADLLTSAGPSESPGPRPGADSSAA